MIITDKLKNNIEIVNTYVDKYGCVVHFTVREVT